MTQLILKTNDSYSPTILRVVLGLVMLAHGSQKMLGWFGGFGFTNSMGYFTGTVHLPWIIALLVICIEFFGSIALILGLYTRVAALAISGVILGIIITDAWPNGFFMNWFGVQKGEGIEYFLLFLGGLASLIISGGGLFSVDKAIAPKQA